MRKNYSGKFKTKVVVVDVMKEQETVAELSSFRHLNGLESGMPQELCETEGPYTIGDAEENPNTVVWPGNYAHGASLAGK